MSVRAYRINKIEVEHSPSFNLWHDEKLMDLIGNELTESLNQDSCGITEVRVDTLKSIVSLVDSKLEPDVIESLKEDIEWADKNNTDWVRYECY